MSRQLRLKSLSDAINDVLQDHTAVELARVAGYRNSSIFTKATIGECNLSLFRYQILSVWLCEEHQDTRLADVMLGEGFRAQHIRPAETNALIDDDICDAAGHLATFRERIGKVPLHQLLLLIDKARAELDDLVAEALEAYKLERVA